MQRDELHQEAKPFKLQYDPGDDIPRTNCVNKTYDSVLIRDLRGCVRGFSFQKNGFSILRLESQLEPDEFYDQARVEKVYYPELQNLLRQYLGAKRVEVLEHLVRDVVHDPYKHIGLRHTTQDPQTACQLSRFDRRRL